MARRSTLPPHVQAELQQRAQFGSGHDMEAATLHFGNHITAYDARLLDPSPEMMAVVKSVWTWIEEHGGTAVGILIDIRHAKHPGCITLSWGDGPSAKAVAEQFAVRYTTDGLAQIPGWLSLKNEDDWDLRWQPTYGPLINPAEQKAQTADSALSAPLSDEDTSPRGVPGQIALELEV